MYQGTTPAIIFEVEEFDLREARVFVTFGKNNELLTKTEVGVSYDATHHLSTVVCPLTQEETLAMRKGAVVVQIRFIYSDGNAYATNKATIDVEDVLYKEVIAYGGDGE